MNNILETIRDEWERSILTFLVLLLLCCIGFFAYSYLNREEEDESVRKEKPVLPSYYDVSLMRTQAVQSLASGVNPMSCVFEKPARPKPAARPFHKPAVRPPWKPAVKPAAKPAVQPPKKQPPKAKPVPKRKRTFEFVYVGNMSIAGGSSGAQLYVSEVLSAKQSNRFKARLHRGESLFNGLFKVVAFDKRHVILVHSGNQRLVVPMGAKKRSIQLEVSDR